MPESSNTAVPQAQLTLFRSICIIVGVIVGSGIFESPPRIAGTVSNWWGLSPPVWVLLVWVIGGILSFLGALCYAELATTYPREGGDYVYLNRAFGPWCGFLFGWARLAIIQGGSIGAIAYVFGDYATRFYPLGKFSATIFAATATVILTGINVIGVREGATTQNILTIVKVLGLAVVFLVAFLFNPAQVPAGEISPVGAGNFALAMVFVSWTYGGWNEIAYVAAEVKDPRRNISRSLIIGLGAVIVIYILVNVAFVHSLGVEGMKSSSAVASDVLKLKFGETGARTIAALVVVSALGALNGFILTSARVYYAMGVEHRVFGPLGRWNERFGTPVAALILQGVIILVLIVAFGSRNGFDTMVKFTAAAFWAFIALTTCALIALRDKDREIERPYRVPGYPFLPIIFCGFSAFMVYRSVDYAPTETFWAVLILIIGLPLYWLSRWQQWRAKP